VAPLAAVAAHLSALPNGFTWLDHGDLESGAAIAAPAQWLGLFTSGFARTGFYRPLTALSLSLDGLFGAPWAFHLHAVLTHALAAYALVLAADALGLERRVSAVGGVLFAVHPVTSVVADQASFRGEALVAAALFGLIAAHLHGRAVFAGLLMLAGGLTKETGLVLGPLFVVVLWITQTRRGAPPFTPSGVEGRWRLFAAEGLGLAGAVALRLAFAPAWRSHQPALDVSQAIGTRLVAVAQSGWALIAPSGVCDAVRISPPWDPWALAGLAVTVALCAIAWRNRRLGLLMLCAGLPALNLIAAPRFWSPHYLYLPWAFLALILAARVAEHRWMLAVLAALSLWDARRFENDQTLFAAEAQRPECREAQLYAADALRQAGDLENAAAMYERAASPAPGFVAYSDERAAKQNLGLTRLAQGQYFEAELAFTEALEKSVSVPDRDELTHNLAAVAVARGDPAGAARLLEPIVAFPTARRESILLLARAYHDMGRDEAAQGLLRRLTAAP
jgi:hypothetical protein